MLLQIDVISLLGMFSLEFPMKFMKYCIWRRWDAWFLHACITFLCRLMKNEMKVMNNTNCSPFIAALQLTTYMESSLIYHISKMIHHYGSSSPKELEIMHDCTLYSDSGLLVCFIFYFSSEKKELVITWKKNIIN